MNSKSIPSLRFKFSRLCLLLIPLGLVLTCRVDLRAANEGLGEKTREVVADTTDAVADGMEELKDRVNEARFENRTPHQIAAWAIMGILAGSVAGMMSGFKSTGMGRAGRLLLGLAGAFLGGVLASVTRVDFDLDPIRIRYEELLFSLLGALVLIGIGRFFQSRYKKKSR